ncbi:MAG: formylglycine-generating enzyme family protein, partial [Planctomycetota bacterium]
ESAAGVLAALPTGAADLARAASAADGRAFALLSRRLKDDPAAVAAALEPLARPQGAGGALSGAMMSWLPPEVASGLKRSRVMVEARRKECRRRARAIAALAFVGKRDTLWRALADSAAPDLVAEIRFVAPVFMVDAGELVRRYGLETDATARRNLLGLLGAFDPKAVPPESRKQMEERLLREFVAETDPGVHAAAEWLLRWRWSRGADVDQITQKLRGKELPAKPPAGFGWRVNGQGQTLVSIPAGLRFDMGADPADPQRTRQGSLELEKRHRVEVAHGFEIGSREVTVGEYRRFRTNHVVPERNNPDGDDRVPVTGVSWLDAAAYCQWLSRQEMNERELEKEWCLNPVGTMVAVAPDPIRRKAYRLPTEEEWELAARAGNTMAFPCGNHDRHLGSHGVTWANGGDRLWPCGRLLPNAWGLFDTSGNALEWTLDKFVLYETNQAKAAGPEGPVAGTYVDSSSLRALMGGSFAAGPAAARMSARGSADAGLRAVTNGFRVCRTTVSPSGPVTGRSPETPVQAVRPETVP